MPHTKGPVEPNTSVLQRGMDPGPQTMLKNQQQGRRVGGSAEMMEDGCQVPRRRLLGYFPSTVQQGTLHPIKAASGETKSWG